jgi:hypothetical protein
MAPPMAMQLISVQSFTPGTIQSSIPNEQVAQGGFHSAMTANFAGDPYVNNGLGDEDGHWPVAFNSTDPNFYESQFAPNLNTTSYVDIGETPNDQALLDPSDDNGHSLRARGFEDYQSTRNLRYNGAS